VDKLIVYIASPYTRGDVEQNVRAQIDAAEIIRNAGHIPFAPLLSHYWNREYPHTWQYWMDLCLDWIRRVDAVIRLPGPSIGADMEANLARKLGLPVYDSTKGFLRDCEAANER
jgi:hypothetical protein